MLAPLEYPTPSTAAGLNPYSAAAARTNSASSRVRAVRSCTSNTPSARRRKNRGMPCSSTFPRGLSRPAPGASASPRGRRSVSSPPVPCSNSNTGPSAVRPGTKRCTNSGDTRHRPLAGATTTREAERGEARLDRRAVGLKPGRQPEPSAERVGSLIHRETRRVRRDLEQHAARLVEVDRPEVLAVQDRGDAEVRLHEPLPPSLLCLVRRRAPSDMVHRADRHVTGRRVRRADDIHPRGEASVTHTVPAPVTDRLDK